MKFHFSKLTAFIIAYFVAVLGVAIIFNTTSLFSAQQIVAPLCEFKNIPAGETSKREIRLQNPTSKPIQFIGANVPCTLCGCVDTEGLPITIPAGKSKRISILFKATEAGTFNAEVDLFTNSPEQLTVRLHVAGNVQTKIDSNSSDQR